MTPPEPVLRAIALIEANLRAEIGVADMADAAGYSLYHFCRIFSKSTRHSPYDYLIRRRMTLAAGEVLVGERRLVDIALDYRFESHDGFTRAFTRMCGAVPVEARRRGWIPLQSRLPRLSAEHLAQLERQNGLVPTRETAFGFQPGLMAHNWAEILPVLRAGQAAGLLVAPVWPAASVEPPLPWTGPAACFRLVPPWDELGLILDWILHVWLFYTGGKLEHPLVVFQPQSDGSLRLCLGVGSDTLLKP